jgi:hypothetical protein
MLLIWSNKGSRLERRRLLIVRRMFPFFEFS